MRPTRHADVDEVRGASTGTLSSPGTWALRQILPRLRNRSPAVFRWQALPAGRRDGRYRAGGLGGTYAGNPDALRRAGGTDIFEQEKSTAKGEYAWQTRDGLMEIAETHREIATCADRAP